MKKTFKDILKELKPLKKLEDDTKLPHYFDLMWDCKYGRDLKSGGHLKKPSVNMALREYSYDIENFMQSSANV